LKQQRSVLAVLFHDARILEAAHHTRFALNARVTDRANFFAVKMRPSAPVVFAEEWRNRSRVTKVDECVTYVALILEINW
jgi:hypothetical protein